MNKTTQTSKVYCCELKHSTIDCCITMHDTINCKGSRIGYFSQHREYYVERNGTTPIHILYYCPWCGKKLPDSLRNELFDILEKEYGIDDDLDKRVPKEFKTDEWWKKRNL